MQVVKLTSHLRLNLHMHHRVKYTSWRPKYNPCRPKYNPCRPKYNPCRPNYNPCRPKCNLCRLTCNPCRPKQKINPKGWNVQIKLLDPLCLANVVIKLCPYSSHKLQVGVIYIDSCCCPLEKAGFVKKKWAQRVYLLPITPLRARARLVSSSCNIIERNNDVIELYPIFVSIRQHILLQEIAANEPWREIVRRRDSETSLATGDINTPLLWKFVEWGCYSI